jgi:hypothetical protein
MEEHDAHVAHSHMMNPSASMVNLVPRLGDGVAFDAKDSLMSPPENVLVDILTELRTDASPSSQKQTHIQQDQVQPLLEVGASWRTQVSTAAVVVRINVC